MRAAIPEMRAPIAVMCLPIAATRAPATATRKAIAATRTPIGDPYTHPAGPMCLAVGLPSGKFFRTAGRRCRVSPGHCRPGGK